MNLHYLRDTEGCEVDFVIIKNKTPLFLVECKCGEQKLSPTLNYYKSRLNIPKAYQVHLGSKDFGNKFKEGRVLPLTRFAEIENLL